MNHHMNLYLVCEDVLLSESVDGNDEDVRAQIDGVSLLNLIDSLSYFLFCFLSSEPPW